jgi:hypothetical protein
VGGPPILSPPATTPIMTQLPRHTAPPHDRSSLQDRLRRTEEALADQLIERRLDRDRMALLRVQVADLKEEVGRLRRAIEGGCPESPRRSYPSRGPVRRGGR